MVELDPEGADIVIRVEPRADTQTPVGERVGHRVWLLLGEEGQEYPA